MPTEQQPHFDANTTMAEVGAIMKRRFDIASFADALKESGTAHVPLSDFEYSLLWTGPQKRQLLPQLYDAESGGFQETPVDTHVYESDVYSPGGNKQTITVFDKREDLQPAGNYKLRVARMAITEMLLAQPAYEFNLASAGNFGVSAAYTTQGMNAHITNKALQYHVNVFCRTDTSEPKLNMLKQFGARTHADYSQLEDALAAAEKRATGNPEEALLHPFDALASIAGSVTATLEYFAQLKSHGIDLHSTNLDIFEPIGGGGKIAATITALRILKKYRVIGDNVRVIGVEAENNNSAFREIFDEPPLTAELGRANTIDTDAEGTATLRSGRRTVPVIEAGAEELLTVPKEYLVRACGTLGMRHGVVPELAGALSYAGFLYLAETDEKPYRNIPLTTTTGRNVSGSFLIQLSEQYQEHSKPLVRAAAAQIKAALPPVRKSRSQPSKSAHGTSETVDIDVPKQPRQSSKRRKDAPGRTPLFVWGSNHPR